MGNNHGHHPGEVSEPEARAKALESLLRERGIIAGDLLDRVIERYTTDIGPLNGARAVAHAWVDPEYRQRLLDDATGALSELGIGGMQGEHMVAVENTPTVHNVVVCTLCSCYPWPVLGLPPRWYKDAPYRARVVREPRAVIAEFGTEIPDDVEIRVWDSSAELRYLVLPQLPDGTAGWTEEQLQQLVTRDSMIGVALALDPADVASADIAAG